MKSSTTVWPTVSLLLLPARGTAVAKEGVLEQCWERAFRATGQLETCHRYLPWRHAAALQSKSAPILPFVTAQPQSTFPNDRKKILQLYVWNPNLNKSSRAGMTAPGLDSPLFTQIFTSVDFKGDIPDLHRGRYKPMNLQLPKGQTPVKQEPLCEQLSIPIKSCLRRKHISC